MKRYYENFLLIVQMITRIPVKRSLPCSGEDFRRGSAFFFIIGLIIGGLQYAVYFLLRNILPAFTIAIVIILIDIFITGGFHIDGFGDTCDGFFAAKGKDKIIDIMKDSRIGTFACIGIIMNLLIKFQGYMFISANSSLALLIIAIPMISRASMLLLCYIGKPAKSGGLGNLFINNVTIFTVIINFLICFLAAFLAVGTGKALILLASTIVVTYAFNALCNNKINGITGDSLGAVNEISVLVSLVIATAF
ncbi:cobalamin-5'-phosphate synthase [Clostridium amylolyticum]|uniref:Adenosylcobinamide-GDP ribazoletransferase n=1 Tax=Clostridium amylolyticum TaxID=1121298 RepID=A0A1M6ES60_9CLOT|nr:adenosylcobinamide-GDP ribazoletransferase [Clostridium amylolyticum]SHI88311.1 cobalamin-5'-phosphate synthase [Clostridium amylolyticum]